MSALAEYDSSPPPLAVEGGIVAFSLDDSIQDVLQSLAEKGTLPNPSLVPGGLSTAVSVGAPKVGVVIVDISDSPDPVADIAHLVAAGTGHIIATGPVNDIALYRALVDAGAVDYLVTPLDEGELVRSLRKREDAAIAREHSSKATMTAIVGARGGVGATTIAVSLAWIFAHEYREKTTLVDLDLQFGTCALALDLLPGRGLREALESPDRIDSMFVSSAMVNESENLFLLGGEEPLEDPLYLSPNAIELLCESVSAGFRNVVIDLPRILAAAHQPILDMATKVVVVSDLSLPGMRDTMRLKGLLDEQGQKTKLQIVVIENALAKSGISKADFERGIDGKITHIVPHDAKLVAEAANAGRAIPALANKRRPLAKQLRQIAAGLCGPRVPAKKRMWLLR